MKTIQKRHKKGQSKGKKEEKRKVKKGVKHELKSDAKKGVKRGKKQGYDDEYARPVTSREKLILEQKKQAKLDAEFERKENEKYEEYIRIQREQNVRAALLSEPIKSIDVMRRAYVRKKLQDLESKKWDKYLSCWPLPEITDYSAVRDFIQRWENEIQDYIKNNCSWVLDVDERSVLTQDMRVKNQCFWPLWNEQPYIADQYIIRIGQCLTLLHELDLSIIHNLGNKTLLLEVKKELRSQLQNVLDKYIIRVLTNVEHDMTRINPYTSKYEYSCKYFQSSLWSTRPVPQPPWKITQIEFPVIDAVVILPSKMKTDKFSFYGLLMNYDHFSDTAATFHLNIDYPIPDLRTVNEQESKKQEDIMREKLDTMREMREKWEQQEQAALEKEETNKNKRGKEAQQLPVKKKHAKKQGKKKSGKHIPQIVTEKTVVDVSEDFAQYENEMLSQKRLEMGPELLNLSEYEINLREYQIVGGIYAFYYMKRPEQYVLLEEHFLFKHNTHQILEEGEINDLDRPIEIRLKLKDHINWWITPNVCYWQPWEQSDEFFALSPELQDFHINYARYIKKIEQLLFTSPPVLANYSKIERINDFQLKSIPQHIDFYNLITNYIVPRIPITYKFQVEIHEEREAARKKILREKEAAMEKVERNIRRRQEFELEMTEYLEKLRGETAEKLEALKCEYETFYTNEANRLFSEGENERQIEKYIKFQRLKDTEYLKDIENEYMSNYYDHYETQFKVQVLDAEEEDSKIGKMYTEVEQQPPQDLFPAKQRQRPLQLVNNEVVENFDVPDVNNYTVCNAEEMDEEMLLSTFLKYLNMLLEKDMPVFVEKMKASVFEVMANIKTKMSTKKKSVSASLKRSVIVQTISEEKSILDNPSQSEHTEEEENHKKHIKGKNKKKENKNKNINEKKKISKSKSKNKKGAFKIPPIVVGGVKKKKNKGKKLQKIKPPSNEVINVEPQHPEQTDAVIRVTKPCTKTLLSLVPHFPGKWIRQGINVIDFDKESREVKFETSQFGIYGFAMPKYSNFPLEYWELYPNESKKNSVIMKVVGKFVEIQIEITENGYVIEKILPNNINFEPNKDPMDYRELKTFLTNCAINLFPEHDAAIYVEENFEKHSSMEEHTYYCLAQFSSCYYFCMSPFNRLVDRRVAVFRAFEKLEKVEPAFIDILITPQKCNFVLANEMVKKTGEKQIDFKLVPEEQEFYPDVYNLLLANCNELSKKYFKQMKKVHCFNVARMLSAVKPLSYG